MKENNYLVHLFGNATNKCDSCLGCDQKIVLIEAKTPAEAADFVLKSLGIKNLKNIENLKSENELDIVIKDMVVYELANLNSTTFTDVDKNYKEEFRRFLKLKNGDKK